MKFGIIIRSIKERTESLAIESAKRYAPKNTELIVLRDYYPAHKVYLEMYKVAIEKKFDWYLALDADIVLIPNWFNKIKKIIYKTNNDYIFRVVFNVIDGIQRERLDYGQHLYNGKYSELLYNQLNNLTNKVKAGELSANKLLKPEGSVARNLINNGYKKIGKRTIIGFHGYEQYYSEIFRRYLIRYHRNNLYADKYFNLLKPKYTERLKQKGDIDCYVANLAWNSAKKFNITSNDARIVAQINKFLEKYCIKEKKEINITLEEFYKKYEKDYSYFNSYTRKLWKKIRRLLGIY